MGAEGEEGSMRTHALRQARRLATATAASAALSAWVLAGAASASPQVATASASPGNDQTVTVSGSGFPVRSKDPTGVQIIECSDPQGLVAALPTSASNCDGATENPLPVNVDANGSFTTQYTFTALSGRHGTANIVCDATHYCVLWVGIDFNQAFLATHAFSPAFRIGGAPAGSSSDTLVIVLPIVGVVLVGGALLVAMRRRRPDTAAAGATGKARSGVPA